MLTFFMMRVVCIIVLSAVSYSYVQFLDMSTMKLPYHAARIMPGKALIAPPPVQIPLLKTCKMQYKYGARIRQTRQALLVKILLTLQQYVPQKRVQGFAAQIKHSNRVRLGARHAQVCRTDRTSVRATYILDTLHCVFRVDSNDLLPRPSPRPLNFS